MLSWLCKLSRLHQRSKPRNLSRQSHAITVSNLSKISKINKPSKSCTLSKMNRIGTPCVALCAAVRRVVNDDLRCCAKVRVARVVLQCGFVW